MEIERGALDLGRIGPVWTAFRSANVPVIEALSGNSKKRDLVFFAPFSGISSGPNSGTFSDVTWPVMAVLWSEKIRERNAMYATALGSWSAERQDKLTGQDTGRARPLVCDNETAKRAQVELGRS
eukprot:IDg11937t1